jgi:hypothetical protein
MRTSCFCYGKEIELRNSTVEIENSVGSIKLLSGTYKKLGIAIQLFCFWGTGMFLQFASDGNWEEALRFDSGSSKEVLKDWLKTASDDVAVELFSDEASLIGLRLKPFQHEAKLLSFCENPTMESLREIFGAALFRGKPDYAELGVVNAWKSLGSSIIWRQGERLPNIENLEIWIRPKPIALEFAYNQPLPHWQAFPVSVKTEQGYRLDLDLLRQVLAAK